MFNGGKDDEDSQVCERLERARLRDVDAQAAMCRMFRRYGSPDDLSDDDRASLALVGLSGPEMRRLLKRGTAADGLGDKERQQLAEAGVWDPEAQV